MSKIEFIEKDHVYLVDGMVTPSVTQIIRSVVDEGYDQVPPRTLQAAAKYGNEMHEWIENYFLTGNADMSSLTNVQKLSAEKLIEMDEINTLRIHLPSFEMPVSYKHLYAGKYDILLVPEDKRAILIDIKTTAKFDQTYLEWQLGMYKLAIKYTQNIDVHDCYCLWVPKKQLPQLIGIQPKLRCDCIKLAEDYRDQHREEAPSWLNL